MARSGVYGWWPVRRLYRYWRYWQVTRALLRMAEQMRHGVGYSCQWFEPDTPLDGVLCWIEWIILATPKVPYLAYDQFEVRVFPVTAAEWERGIWQALPWGEAPLFGDEGLTWSGDRVQWMRRGRITVTNKVEEDHVGLYVVVWAMSPVMRAALAT